MYALVPMIVQVDKVTRLSQFSHLEAFGFIPHVTLALQVVAVRVHIVGQS